MGKTVIFDQPLTFGQMKKFIDLLFGTDAKPTQNFQSISNVSDKEIEKIKELARTLNIGILSIN